MSSWAKSLPITPVLLGAAFAVLSAGPDSLRDPVLKRLQAYLSPQQIAQLIKTLKWILIANSTIYANGFLNELALNNFRASSRKGWDWPQEIAVITGGTGGFGKLFTKDLTAKGVHVVALDVGESPPPEFASNSKVTYFRCDVTDVEQVRATAKQIQQTVGHPSILINNAGIANNGTILDLPSDRLEKIVGVNLLSHYYLVQQFLPHMLEKNKGHIITIASMASFVAQPLMADYCITKAGVQAFHEALTSEIRGIHGCPDIRTTIVHPLWAMTPMVAPHAEELRKGGQRIMDPQEVSDAVVQQISSGRSGKLILGQGTSVIKRFRFYPDWVAWLLRRGTEVQLQKRVASPNKKAI